MGQQESLPNCARHNCGLLPLLHETWLWGTRTRSLHQLSAAFPACIHSSPRPSLAPPDAAAADAGAGVGREEKPPEKSRALGPPESDPPSLSRNLGMEGGETQGSHSGNSPGFHGISHGPEQSPFILITLQNNL